jgi:hypothetical protein
MRSTKIKDTEKVHVRIRVGVDIPMIAVYALHSLLEYANPVEVLCACNKRQLFALTRVSLTNYGRATAFEQVPPRVTREELDIAEAHVRLMFPEIANGEDNG